MRDSIPKLRLSTLYIDAFRKFKDFHINFTEDVSVLIGPNGIGKSSILQLIAYCYGQYGLTDLSAAEFSDDTTIIFEFDEIKVSQVFIETLKIPLNVFKYTTDGVNIVEAIKKLQKNPNTPVSGTFTTSELVNKMVKVILSIGSQKNIRTHILYNNELINFSYWDGLRNLLFDECLCFNDGEFRSGIINKLEELPRMNLALEKFTEKASAEINNEINLPDQNIRYTTLPHMEATIENSQGISIKHMSSGEKQIMNLKFLVKSAKKLNKKLVIIDEPELHLNYGQMLKISDLIQELVILKIQVIIASHSHYFVRSTTKGLLYLNMDTKKLTPQCHITNPTQLKKILNYPGLFTSDKVVLVEESSTKIYLERTFNLLRNLDKSEVNQNIEFIATHGKSNFKEIISFCSDKDIDTYVITDFDFTKNKEDFNFIEKGEIDYIIKRISTLNPPYVSKHMFRKIPLKDIQLIIKTLQLIVDKEEIDDLLRADIKTLLKSRSVSDLSKGIKVKTSWLKKFMHTHSVSQLIKVFKKNKIWVLNNGEIEDYIVDIYHSEGKLNIVKLNESYYPIEIEDIKKSIKSTKAFKEINDIYKFIYN